LKFIVDESSGAAVAEYLRSIGHDVLAVAEVLPQMVQVVVEQHADQLADHFTVATESGIRIRPARELP